MLLLVSYQLLVLHGNIRGSDRQRYAWAQLATVLHRSGVRAPCTVLGDQSPPIGWDAGCSSHLPRGSTLPRLGSREPVAIVRASLSRRLAGVSTWSRITVPTPYRKWTVYLSPGTRRAPCPHPATEPPPKLRCPLGIAIGVPNRLRVGGPCEGGHGQGSSAASPVPVTASRSLRSVSS